jgi:MFS family permease
MRRTINRRKRERWAAGRNAMGGRVFATHTTPRAQWAAKTAIILAGFIGVVATAVLAPLLPQMQRELAHTESEKYLVKMLLMSASLAAALGAPLAGGLADRIGLKRLLLVALCVFGVVGTAGAALTNLWALLLDRVVVGLAAGAISTVAAALVADLFEGVQRARWMGFTVGSGTAGVLILFPIAGMLGELSWRAAFSLHLLALPALFLTWIGVPDRPRVGAAARVAPLWPNWPFALMAIGFLNGLIMLGATAYVPFHLRQIGAMGPTFAAFAFVPTTVVSSATALSYGLIRARMSARKIFLLSYATLAVGIGAAGLPGSYAMVLLCLAVAGVGVGLATANLLTITAACVAPDHRGLVIGLVRGAEAVGGFASVIVLEPISAAAGAGASMIAAAAVAALLGLALLGPGRRLYDRGAAPAPV